MRYFIMRRIYLVILICTVMGSQAFSQLNHFIYLQTDNQQPFYIKYNNRIHSSSVTGYLILSKLKDGAVDFSVGFPKSDQPEQKFQCIIDKSDKGYLIKNFADKGWGLYDLQNSSVVYAVNIAETKTNNPVVNANQQVQDDPFANMLSKVTQDSTVKNVTVRKEEKAAVVDTPKPIPVPTQIVVVQQPVKDSVKTETPEQPVKTNEPVVTETLWVAPQKSSVHQIRKFDSREGRDFVFEVVNAYGAKDTIRLFIEKDSSIVEVTSPLVITTEIKTDTIPVIKEEKKEPPVEPTLKTEEPVKEEIKQPNLAEHKTESKALPNTNCKAVAAEDDFMKLRRKMANESKDEEMVNEAKKAFRSKCFSTEQVKNLAVLFLNDEGRYRLYDAAMLYITDFSNFKSLLETIKDEYYRKRFLALLPNQ